VAKAEHDYGKAAEWFAKGRDVLLPWHEKKMLVGQFKNAVPAMEQRIAVCRNAEKAVAGIDFIFTQKPEQVPGLLDVRVKALLKRRQLEQGDGLVDKVIGLLIKAKAGGYFTPPRIAYIKQDSTFDAIRKHSKFAQFMAELESKK